jgi:hypothetical protein
MQKPNYQMSVKLIVNSFTGNSIESSQSEEVERVLHLMKVKYEKVDINQEMVFSRETSK